MSQFVVIHDIYAGDICESEGSMVVFPVDGCCHFDRAYHPESACLAAFR